MRYWIFDRDATPQGRPLRRLLDHVRAAVAPGAVTVRVTRSWGYGLRINEWLEALDTADALEVSLDELAELSTGVDEWFYDFEARLDSITFGLHDSHALFIDAPPPLARSIARAFTKVKTDTERSALADPDNDLVAMAARFTAREDPWWYVDRHVLDAGVAGGGHADPALIRSACVAAVSLAWKWAAQRAEALSKHGCLVSAPCAIIDDDWLHGHDNAAPPHVYITMARAPEALESAYRIAGTPCSSSGNVVVDSLLTGRETLSRLEPAPDPDDGGGCWVLKIPA